jgi:hypothetical protein
MAELVCKEGEELATETTEINTGLTNELDLQFAAEVTL